MGNILYRIHGLQFSPRLDVRRSAARSIWRGAAADQSHVLLVDNAERMGVEVERPFALFGLLDSDHFASQSLRDVDEAAIPLDLAIVAHATNSGLGRIVRLGQRRRHGSRRGAIMLRRGVHAERLMRAQLIVFAAEGVEGLALRSLVR